MELFEWKTYLIYHARWQLSAVIMMPPMLLLTKYIKSTTLKLMISSFVGASIFWYVDKLIFKG